MRLHRFAGARQNSLESIKSLMLTDWVVVKFKVAQLCDLMI